MAKKPKPTPKPKSTSSKSALRVRFDMPPTDLISFTRTQKKK